MALIYDLQTDIRFKQGEAQGEARGRNGERTIFIEKLIRSGLLSHEQIAEMAEVTLGHVQAIAQRIANA